MMLYHRSFKEELKEIHIEILVINRYGGSFYDFSLSKVGTVPGWFFLKKSVFHYDYEVLPEEIYEKS